MSRLIGLVACGGSSSRMGEDKCFIKYQELPQCYHIYKQLELVCDEVWIIVNDSQSGLIDRQYNFFTDCVQYRGHGPISALLSAFEKFPDDSFILLGCDYPMLTNVDISELVNNRSGEYAAVSFYNADEGLFEPLLAVYENCISGKLFENFRSSNFSLQSLLRATATKKLVPSHELKSIDSKEEMRRFITCRP